jgi:hypothetical protein
MMGPPFPYYSHTVVLPKENPYEDYGKGDPIIGPQNLKGTSGTSVAFLIPGYNMMDRTSMDESNACSSASASACF